MRHRVQLRQVRTVYALHYLLFKRKLSAKSATKTYVSMFMKGCKLQYYTRGKGPAICSHLMHDIYFKRVSAPEKIKQSVSVYIF